MKILNRIFAFVTRSKSPESDPANPSNALLFAFEEAMREIRASNEILRNEDVRRGKLLGGMVGATLNVHKRLRERLLSAGMPVLLSEDELDDLTMSELKVLIPDLVYPTKDELAAVQTSRRSELEAKLRNPGRNAQPAL